MRNLLCHDNRKMSRESRLRMGARAMLLVTASSLAFTATSALAQDNDGVLEEIIVTAQKRGAQSIQDVPISMQAIGGDELNALGAVEFGDIAMRIPGMTFQDLGPGDKEYVIRGVNSTGTATTGVYFDEAVITARNKQDGGGRQADIELHDLARVEVLKGPQGTLYGASSMSGTIRFIPNQPDLSETSGRAEATISDTRFGASNYSVNGHLNLPLVEDKLGVRAVGWITDDSGFIDNVRLGRDNINSNNVEGGRLMVRWEPQADLTISAMALVQKRSVGGSSRYMPVLDPSYEANIIAGGFPEFAPGDLVNQDFAQSPWDENIQLFGAKVEWDTDAGSLLATTNWFERDVDFYFDSTPILLFFGVPVAATTFEPQSRRIWSTELRWAATIGEKVNYVIGGLISREKKNFEVQVIATNNLGLPAGEFRTDEDFFAGTGPAFFGREKNDSVDEEAIFGEVTYQATEQLAVTVGLRYFQVDFASDGRQTKPFGGFPPGSNPPIDLVQKDDDINLKVNIAYKVNDDALVYVTAAEGYRIGGTNDAAINPIGAPIPDGFAADSLWNYEFGWKTSWLDNRLTFNGAIYLIRWKNMQVESVDASGAFPFIANAGTASIDGIELELNYRPNEHFDIFLGASWQDARLTEDQPLADPANPNFDPNAGRDGDALPNVPDFQAGASVQYFTPLGENLNGTFRMDLVFRGSTKNQINPTSPVNVDLRSYTLINLSASVSNEQWTLTGFIKNASDQRAQIDAINSFQDPLAFITVRPRTIGIQVARFF